MEESLCSTIGILELLHPRGTWILTVLSQSHDLAIGGVWKKWWTCCTQLKTQNPPSILSSHKPSSCPCSTIYSLFPKHPCPMSTNPPLKGRPQKWSTNSRPLRMSSWMTKKNCQRRWMIDAMSGVLELLVLTRCRGNSAGTLFPFTDSFIHSYKQYSGCI